MATVTYDEHKTEIDPEDILSWEGRAFQWRTRIFKEGTRCAKKPVMNRVK